MAGEENLPAVRRDDGLAEANAGAARVRVAGPEHPVVVASVRVHRVERPAAVTIAQEEDLAVGRIPTVAAGGAERKQRGEERQQPWSHVPVVGFELL